MNRLFVCVFVLMVLFSCKKEESKLTYKMTLNSEWKIQSALKVKEAGEQLSLLTFNDSAWINAIVPGTVLNSLVEAKVLKDIYVGRNMEKIPAEQFDTSWFYRTEFEVIKPLKASILAFEGINYKANVWLNGQKICDKTQLLNSFRQFEFNVSSNLKEGKNVLVIEVFPPKPGDFTMGFVDWNPKPTDGNMGIFRNVNLYFNQGVRVKHSYIESKLDDNYKSADLYFSAELNNFTDADVAGTLKITGKNLIIKKSISLKKNETKIIKLSSKDFPELKIKNPDLWWPHTIGKPNLYQFKVEFNANGNTSDYEEITVGIRKFESYFTPEGHRGFMVNGQKISVRGGGWVDDLTLNDTPEFIRNQLEYVKDMNLNTIRLEGFWGKDHSLYQMCDEMGIMVMVGWSCQWEWDEYVGRKCDDNYGGITSENDIKMMSEAWKDQILWLRNHASIFAWLGGSDKIPTPELEKNYFEIFKQYDSTRVYLPSAKEWKSLAGPSGVKMRGPYAYVPPVYWFTDTIYGGAFGFNTETGPDAQVPPIESIKKMIPADKLWPINEDWEFHCGRNAFQKLDRYEKAIALRYGKVKNVEDFAFKSQILNYELMRPMFEAFSINRYKATGVIQWMLNSAWPEMYWQLYDSYLMPNGAYYGAKKAGQPIHAVYNYGNNSIYLVNDKLSDSEPLNVEIKVYDINSKLIHEKTLEQKIPANQSLMVYQIPELKDLSKTYFLVIKTYNNQQLVDDNFYWLSTKKDILDYKTSTWYQTPSKEYADFTQLNQLEPVKVESTIKSTEDSDYQLFDIDLKNSSSKIAFFIESRIVNKADGASILPVLWSDNYVSLLPGETKKLQAKIRKQYLNEKTPDLILTGWNLTK